VCAQRWLSKALTNVSVPTTTANPTRPAAASNPTVCLAPRLIHSPVGEQAPRATKITGQKPTAVEFSTSTCDPGTHENRGFGPEARPTAAWLSQRAFGRVLARVRSNLSSSPSGYNTDREATGAKLTGRSRARVLYSYPDRIQDCVHVSMSHDMSGYSDHSQLSFPPSLGTSKSLQKPSQCLYYGRWHTQSDWVLR
jgi:hypothetical protein